MILSAMLLSCVFFLCVLAIAWPLGAYIYKVMESTEVSFCSPFFLFEKKVRTFFGEFYEQKMTWKEYFFALLAFHTVGIFFLYLVFRFQGSLSFVDPLAKNMSPHMAFNAAISFVTNTNWQSYIPETDVSWIVNALGIVTQQFFSAAVGICVLCVVARSFLLHESKDVGNFWRDLLRASVFILLPLSLIVSIGLVATGVPESFRGAVEYSTLENPDHHRSLPIGCVASQVAIKQLGTNGGGLYEANAAHPFENPTPLSNILELVTMLLIPMACCRTFGEIVKEKRQAYLLLAVMGALFLCACFCGFLTEGAQVLSSSRDSLFQVSGNMEGKECRFGLFWSIIWSVVTTATSTGAVNSSLSSYLPLGGSIPLALMEIGEVICGGIGTGVLGMLVFLFIAIFAAGLMVGRTPEYLGKKIESREMKFVILLAIMPAALVLIGTATSLMTKMGLSSLSSLDFHGITEVLYAFSSGAVNNGSSFSDLRSDTYFYTFSLGIVMYIGRMLPLALFLALAGALSQKKLVAIGAGTLRTDSFAFGMWLVFIVIIIGALNYLPAFTLGPILEHIYRSTGCA